MYAKTTTAIACACALILSASAAHAQAPAPSPEVMKLARDYVAKTDVDRDSTINAMNKPLVGMMQQSGLPADKAQVLVDEALLPLLKEHFDGLLDITAKSYATVLTADDLKAATAFYDTPAGKHLLQAQPQLAQLKVAGMTQWMATLQPEMQTRIQQISKTHGWGAK